MAWLNGRCLPTTLLASDVAPADDSESIAAAHAQEKLELKAESQPEDELDWGEWDFGV